MVPTAEASQDESLTLNPAPRAWRVEVFRRASRTDPEGSEVAGAVLEFGLARAAEGRVGKGYPLSADYGGEAVEEIATAVLADPVVNEVRILAPGSGRKPGNTHRILVSPRPGVMDPVARTV